mmetsp:Transcript_6925/g.14713  ORF Transcript_6925/g.14713 Transcript_6925/m.14713 type:complete len:135 (-) Transcript_6925:1588-1992(-)
MDDVDFAANRVGTMALAGFFSGAAYATYKGFPRRSSALKAGASCALVGTSLFAAERLANIAIRDRIIKDERRLTLSSYAFGGIFGGALNGFLYQRQPIRGMVVFAPFMLGIGMIELELKRRKQKRLEELRQTLE